jgi:hypothetical protein
MTQIAADALGIPIETVTFELGDTKLPPTPVSGGSATASSTGSAVKMACLAARAQLVDLAVADAASPLHGLAAGDVDVDGGALVSKKDRTKRDTIGEVVKRTGKEELSARSDVKPKEERKTHSCHSFGAQFVEVRVDEATGEVRVSRVVSAFAAGKILNAKTARSQFLGGMLAELSASGLTITDAMLARLHAPVGLDRGAETPQEIALAVVSEVQATLTNAAARRLRERSGPIHVPAVAPRRGRVVCVVLGAGASTRLGRPKQLEPFAGKALVRHVVDVVAASSCDAVAWFSARMRRRSRPCLPAPARPSWRTRRGARALPRRSVPPRPGHGGTAHRRW